MISVTIDARGLEQALRAAPAELRRALRNTLNDAARTAQAAIVSGAASRFDIRSGAFLKRSIYHGPQDRATNERLVARVRTNPDRGDIFAKFEDAGVKVPFKANRLAVPSREIRTTGGHVRRGYRLSDFAPFTEAGPTMKLRRRKGQLVSGGRGASRTQLVGQKGSFWVTLRGSGLSALMQRRRGQSTATLLYLLRPTVRIPRSLQFVATGTNAVEAQWESLVAKEVDRALTRAGLR